MPARVEQLRKPSVRYKIFDNHQGTKRRTTVRGISNETT